MIRGMVHSGLKAVEEISISDSYSPDDRLEQKLPSDSYATKLESGFQKKRDALKQMEVWLHSKLMAMPAVIKKIKEPEPGHHHLPSSHLCLRAVCLRLSVFARV